jgi:hypothetical protein
MHVGDNNIVGFCQFHHAENHWADPPHHLFHIYKQGKKIGFVVAATAITQGGLSFDFIKEYLEAEQD